MSNADTPPPKARYFGGDGRIPFYFVGREVDLKIQSSRISYLMCMQRESGKIETVALTIGFEHITAVTIEGAAKELQVGFIDEQGNEDIVRFRFIEGPFGTEAQVMQMLKYNLFEWRKQHPIPRMPLYQDRQN